VIEQIRLDLQLTGAWDRAIDIGCGTGLSSRALAAIAQEVVGLDPSREMIANAEPREHVAYVVGDAEDMPFADASFDAMTLSSVFHWLDRRAFLSHAKRVLRPGASLVIYDNIFSGQMVGDARFGDWVRAVYVARYPIPPQNRQPFGPEEASAAGFEMVSFARYENRVSWSADRLVAYLLTQSNVIAGVEGGAESIDSAKAWLTAQVTPFFDDEEETFVFFGPITYLRSVAQLNMA
jgi:SAM-dependent methyltransferase